MCYIEVLKITFILFLADKQTASIQYIHLEIRTLKGERFPLEVEADDTIENLKYKIQDTQGIDVDMQRHLIYAGRVLSNSLTVESSGIEPNSMLVLMVGPQP